MKKYKVISLSVGGMNNKIYKSQDIVREDSFYPGHAEKLVEQMHLEPFEEKEHVKVNKDHQEGKKRKRG